MQSYELLKILHVATVVLSMTLFVYRYRLLRRSPAGTMARPLKIIPHINDTVLLAAAVGMLIIAGQNPLSHAWLTVKMVALLAYIAIGVLCLRSPAGSARQRWLFLLALLCFAYIVGVAVTKDWLPFTM